MSSSFVALLVLAGAVAVAPAQEPGPVELPELWRLGPLPDEAPAFRLGADARLERAAGERIDLATLQEDLAGGDGDVVLHVDRGTPAAVVGAVVGVCRKAGVARVHFAARLAGGSTTGGFTLVLHDRRRASTTIDLRLSRDRPGVPPESLVPHLRRMREGLVAEGGATGALGVEVVGDAPFGSVLRVLGAVARSGWTQARLDWEPDGDPVGLAERARARPADSGALAMDLGPSPSMQVPAAAVPAAPPRLLDGPVGFTGKDGGITEMEGGAGGRLAGGGAGDEVAAETIQGVVGWVNGLQSEDGSWPGAGGRGAVDTTALVLLAFLGDGQTMDAGANAPVVARGIGWLLARQGPGGRIGPPGPGAVRRHALATFALVEASGLSARGALLRGHAQEALRWLEEQRLPSGGWSDGTRGAAADTVHTAWAAMALRSAVFFGYETRADDLIAGSTG